MSLQVRIDSLYKFALPYYDEAQSAYVWGIADPPPVIKREDDQFYTVRQGDRIDLIAHRMLGDVRYWWIVMHYSNLSDGLDLDTLIGKQLRLPSKGTVERIYVAEFKKKVIS